MFTSTPWPVSNGDMAPPSRGSSSEFFYWLSTILRRRTTLGNVNHLFAKLTFSSSIRKFEIQFKFSTASMLSPFSASSITRGGQNFITACFVDLQTVTKFAEIEGE